MTKPIDDSEFQRWMHVLREDIQGVNTRLDVLNGRTRTNEKAIAVLEDRALRDPAARWGVVGAVIAGVAAEVGHRFFGAK